MSAGTVVPVEFNPFGAGEIERTAPATEAQQEIWAAIQLGGTSANLSYNQSLSLAMRGALDASALRRAVDRLLLRHDALRITFSRDGATLCVLASVSAPFEEDDVSARTRDEQAALLSSAREREARTEFDLERGPLVRFRLFRLGQDRHELLFTAHHLVCDGWSADIVLSELGILYSSEVCEESPKLQAAPRFGDYATHERDSAGSEEIQRNERFWVSRFSGCARAFDLPTDRVRPPERTFDAARENYVLDRDLVRALRAFGKRTNVGFAGTLLAAFEAFIFRISGEPTFAVGMPAAGQPFAGEPGLVGHCVHTLPIPAVVDPELSFIDFARQVRKELLDAFDHQRFTFGTLLKRLSVVRDPSRIPLVPVLFNVDRAGKVPEFARLDVSRTFNPRAYENFELFLSVSESSEDVVLEASFNTNLFDRETVRLRLEEFTVLLDGVARDSSQRLGELPLIPPRECSLLESWETAAPGSPPVRTIAGLFEAQASRTPDAVAARSLTAAVTYRELDERANRLARHLVALGVKPADRVGISLGRGTELLVALLGVLKAGATYVPLDPEFPASRLAFIANDAGLSALVTEASLDDTPLQVETRVVLDAHADRIAACSSERPPREDDAEQIAYVLHTSGSTGKPKGVLVANGSIANFLAAMAREPGLSPDDVVGAVTTLSFDISVLELFLPLTVGAQVVVIPREVGMDGRALAELLVRFGVTFLQATPSTFRLLVEARFPFGARFKALIGGETLPRELALAMVERCGSVWNMYGPTEATVWSTCHRVENVPGSVPIGRPIAGTRLLVLDERRERVPVGVLGELYIGGEGVARGYLGRPELTRERFITISRADIGSGVFYRTGDLVHWRRDGTLLFSRRADNQVKVRGYRIELGEIESVIAEDPRVRECTVVVREDVPGDRRIVAYVASSGPVKPPELRARVEQSLPGYMIPQHFVVLSELPRTPNQKIDRNGLPLPDASGESARERVLPRSESERIVAGIWSTLFGVERVGVDEDFFAMGGHSMLAARMLARVGESSGVDVGLARFFRKPTVEALARYVEQGSVQPSAENPIIPRTHAGPAALSPSQQRLWFMDALLPGTSFLNLPCAFRIRGEFDVEIARRVLGEIVRRHDVLRTSIVQDDTGPKQLAHDSIEVNLELDDLSSWPGREPPIEERLFPWLARPLDPEHGPAWRAGIATLAEGDKVLWFVASHLIWDGVSFELFEREFRVLYDAFAKGGESPLPPVQVSYADYVEWELSSRDDATRRRELDYWIRNLEGIPANLELPLDGRRPAQMSYRGSVVPFAVPADVLSRLRDLGKTEGTTLQMVLLAVLNVALYRYTGERDLVVGTAIDERVRPELKDAIGLFVNTLVLRTKLDDTAPFPVLLAAVRETCIGAYEHRRIPFEQVVEALRPVRDRSRTPLFQVFFAFRQVTPIASGLDLREVEVHAGSSLTDLALYVRDDGATVSGALEYALDLFEEATARRFVACFQELLSEVATAPETRIGDLDGLYAQRAELLEWNAAQPPLARDALVHHFFEKQVDRRPEKIAVWFEGHSVTYRELRVRVNRLARALRSLGVKRDAPVGVCLHRSLDLVVALLAVHTAGGGYLPLDPSYPRERLSFMLADSGARFLVAETSTMDLVESPVERLVLDDDHTRASILRESAEPLDVPGAPDQLAYSIYTSGSTGKPKGVLVEHRNVIAFFRGMEDIVDLRDHGVWLAGTSVSFDISVLEILGSLTHGLTVVLLGDQLLGDARRSDFGIARLIERFGITHFQCTPSQIATLIEDPETRSALGRLRQLILAGEALSETLVLELSKVIRGQIVNAYGPTETTVWSSAHAVQAQPGPVPIGRPIANTRFYVLDPELRQRPIGAAGELHIAGPSVARGYHARPELTRERFLDDPFVSGARMYRTGDLVRIAAGGVFEYLGRNDHQVKVRGHRVELGEIEAVLAGHRTVKEAVVVARPDSSFELVAYLVPRAGISLDTSALREHARRYLPIHMVPAAFVRMDALPLTPSGKIDRNALPAPVRSLGSAEPRHEPRDEVERRLVAVWQTSLEIPDVGLSDDFFALGGHSLLGVRLLSRVRQEFGVRLSLSALFEAPTVERMAVRVRQEMTVATRAEGRASRSWSTVVPMKPEGSLPPFFCVAGRGGNPMNLRPVAAKLGDDQPFYGLQHRGVDGLRAPHTSVEEMAREFIEDMREVQPHGPYFLGGFSGGGTAALEMAMQLRASGEQIGALVLLDAVNPQIPMWSLAERVAYHSTRVRSDGVSYALTAFGEGLLRRGQDLRVSVLSRLSRWFPYEFRNEAVAAAWTDMQSRYEPQPYPGTVFLLRSRERDTKIFDPRNGWGPVVLGELFVVEVSGGHTSFVSEEHAELTSTCLSNVLATARVPRSGVRKLFAPRADLDDAPPAEFAAAPPGDVPTVERSSTSNFAT